MGKRNESPVSSGRRGGRPAVISCERILDVAEEIPAQSLTMPEVARRLGVDRTALYHHFDSRDALLVALAERLVTDLRIPTPDPTHWRTWLVSAMEEMYRFMRAHPTLLAIKEWRRLVPVGLRLVEAALETLQSAGFSMQDAAMAWRVVSNHASLEARRDHEVEQYTMTARETIGDALSQIPPELKRTRAVISAMGNVGSEELFRSSLVWLVAALPEPRTTRPARRGPMRKR